MNGIWLDLNPLQPKLNQATKQMNLTQDNLQEKPNKIITEPNFLHIRIVQ